MQAVPFFLFWSPNICVVHPSVSGSEALPPAFPTSFASVLKLTLLFSVQMSGGWHKGRVHGVINII